jgi:hypothetical protein
MSDTSEPRPDQTPPPEEVSESEAARPDAPPPAPEAPEPEVADQQAPPLQAEAGPEPREPHESGDLEPQAEAEAGAEPQEEREPGTPESEAESGAQPWEEVPETPEPEVHAEEGSPEGPEGQALEQEAPQEKVPLSEEHERLAAENAQRLEAEIEGLRTEWAEPGHRPYRAFFERERRLHALFKELRPLHAGDRHRLWGTFKQVGTEVRRAQQEDWESRRYQSIEAREAIEEKIRKAETLAQESQSGSDYRRADALLSEIRTLLSGAAPGSPGQVLIGPDRRACWDRWRGVRDVLRQRRGGMQDQDYQALDGLVTEVSERAKSGDAFRAVQQVKELQAQLGKAYLRRGQFEELRRRLSEAWKAAQPRVAEQRGERAKLRAEWRERMEGHLTRWRETREHKQGQREHLLGQLAKLEGMEKNARSEDFAVQVRGWREETSEKLRRVEEFIADLEGRIESVTRKLSGRGRRERPADDTPAPEAGDSGEAAPARAPRARRGGRRRARESTPAEAATAPETAATQDARAEPSGEPETGPAEAAVDESPRPEANAHAQNPQDEPAQGPEDPGPAEPERES